METNPLIISAQADASVILRRLVGHIKDKGPVELTVEQIARLDKETVTTLVFCDELYAALLRIRNLRGKGL